MHNIQRRERHSALAIIGLILLFALWCDLADASSFRTGQAAIDDDPAVTIGTATNRHKLEIRTTAAAFCGKTGVTALTGISVGTSTPLIVDSHSGPFAAREVVQCITASGGATISFIEYTE